MTEEREPVAVTVEVEGIRTTDLTAGGLPWQGGTTAATVRALVAPGAADPTPGGWLAALR